MEKEKIINPKTGKKIDMYGDTYNTLIREGYEYNSGELVKRKQRYVEDSDDEEEEEENEEESIDYEGDDSIENEEELEGLEDLNISDKPQRFIPEEVEEEYYEEQDFVTEPQSVYPTYVYRKPNIVYERMAHVRCIECNKPIGVLEKSFNRLKSQGVPNEEIYQRLGLKRYCCRMHLERPPPINMNQVNVEKMMDYPATKVVNKRDKFTKDTLTNISQNPFLSSVNTNDYIDVNNKKVQGTFLNDASANIRRFEHGLPTQTNINYQNLKTRPLGSKYQVSYIGK